MVIIIAIVFVFYFFEIKYLYYFLNWFFMIVGIYPFLFLKIVSHFFIKKCYLIIFFLKIDNSLSF